MSKAEIIVLTDRADPSTLSELAVEHGWTRTRTTERGHVVMASTEWEDAASRIGYYEDHMSLVRYVRVEGPGAKPIADAIRAVLEHEEIDDLLESGEQAEEVGDSIRALCKLSVAAPVQADPRFIEFWRSALRHREQAVRRAAIRTAYLLPWADIAKLAKHRLGMDRRLRPQLEDLVAFFENE